MKLYFKLRAEHAAERGAVFDALARAGVEVRRLFPDRDDEELSSLFVAETGDASANERALELLRKSPAVEFGEREPRRRLH
jgi:hypothetical protein